MGLSIEMTATIVAFTVTNAYRTTSLAAQASCEGLDGKAQLICFAL
ncbi:hypothetical protein [uncultured Cohaesibacter sp.]|nr:hypothetical protein [uncultured Cohaesibacter sp.]